MFVQKRHATEGPGAGATLVLLHLRVGLHVGAQVGAIGKGPATVLTSKGALTWLKKKKKRERQTDNQCQPNIPNTLTKVYP